MFEKVVIPVELSDLDDKVLRFVSGLKNYGIKEVALVHVSGLKGVERPVAMRQEQRYEAELSERTSLLTNIGLEVKPVLLSGTPHDEIIQVAEEIGASMIICGTRGKGAFNELAVGSVSEAISRKSNIPVAMVPYRTLAELTDEDVAAMGERAFQRILYPTDFSDVAERTLEFLKNLETDKVGEIIIAHVVEPKELKPEHKDAVLRSTARIMGAIKEELSARGFNARIELIVGAVVAELLEMAEENDATCYIVGSHGRGIGGELFMGSVSQNIIRMSKRPVFVIH